MACELNRRLFVVGSASAAASFALAVASPFQSTGAEEINCWVVVAPDDTVTIRIARCEIGQGALTGLAMLVAEELECDWAKVRAEFVSARENMRRD